MNVKNMSLFIFLMLISGVSMHAMDLSSEQQEAAKNWFAAHQDAEKKWSNFDKIKASFAETSLLVDNALDDALATREFNDFLHAKTKEIFLRTKLCKGSPETYRKRALVGMQSYSSYYDEFDKPYGTFGISVD